MLFKYFEHPERFAAWLAPPTTCDICGAEKRCFDAADFDGEESITAICEDCLSGGKLRERDIFTCEGDISELQEQLHKLKPDKSPAAVIRRAGELTDDLERTTPKIVSKQQWYWPCAGGDYCIFIGYGSKALYHQLAPDSDGEEFFKNSMYHTVEDLSDVDELWEDSLPDAAIDSLETTVGMKTLFYVFRSQNGERIFTVWDVA